MRSKAIVWRAPLVIPLTFPPNADMVDTVAFVSDGDYELESVAEAHITLGSNGGAVTLDVVKCTGTVAVSAGATMLASTFNMKSANDTVVTKNRSNGGLAASRPATQIKQGDRIGINFDGTMTALAGVGVTIVLLPIKKRPNY